MKINTRAVAVPRCPPSPIRPPIGCFPIPGGKVTLSLTDRFTAARLPAALQKDLSGLSGMMQLRTAPDATLHRAKDGSMVGPEGQPLVPVKLEGGKTAYVDPNTNQYYVDEGKLASLRMPGSVRVKGPMPLPEGAEFSNSHFSTADCRELARTARDGIFKKDDFQPLPVWKNPVLF
jgi:hypothetical protein